MAKETTPAALATPELPGLKRRGRPPVPGSMTNADRQRLWRARHKAIDTGETIAATIGRLARQFDVPEDQIVRHLLRFALRNRNWSVEGFPGLGGNDAD